MEEKIDPYNYDKRLNSLVRQIENLDISERNKEIISKFKDSCIRNSNCKFR